MAPKKNAPLGCGNNHARGGYRFKLQSKVNTSQYAGQKFKFDRTCLPSPSSYYSYQFPGISTNRTMVKVICPFHDDTDPSLSINLEDGWFNCFSCGTKGGGIAKFHMTRYSLTYKQTLKELEFFNVR